MKSKGADQSGFGFLVSDAMDGSATFEILDRPQPIFDPADQFQLQPLVALQHQPLALRYDMLYGEYGQPTDHNLGESLSLSHSHSRSQLRESWDKQLYERTSGVDMPTEGVQSKSMFVF